MGLYDKVLVNVPKLITDEPERQDRVEGKKIDLRSEEGFDGSALWLAERYEKARLAKWKLEEIIGGMNDEISALEQMIAESHEDGDEAWGAYGASENILRLKGGGKVQVKSEPYAKTIDPETVRLWCISQGLERQMKLPWNSFNGLVRKMLLDKQPPPPGCQVFSRTIVSYTEGKTK